MTSSLLDTALDLSVVGGYTSVGYRIRSRGWKALPRMEGKVVVITGATSGPRARGQLLLPVLEQSAPSRIIKVSSGGVYTQRLRVDDLQSEQSDFDGPTVYARTKRAEVVLTEMCAERLAGTGVTVDAMHPGLGRHPRRPVLAAPLPPDDPTAAAQSGSGRRHDRLPGTRETEAERRRLWAERVALSSASST